MCKSNQQERDAAQVTVWHRCLGSMVRFTSGILLLRHHYLQESGGGGERGEHGTTLCSLEKVRTSAFHS
ncbi:hypothetical protein EYF80_021123 [Liparis tanakae]|uniref:Uncharacterized protein n=1 Tax=Liparis tanakae TaxID=230148 RepID=A0A4Z2HRY5_9TELE|nr:hypothetical protein EYF80_021123 [Liparis tanakae]